MRLIAGLTLAQWQERATFDDCFEGLEPSDLRALVSEIKEPPQAPVIHALQQVSAEMDNAVAKFPTWPTDPLHAVAVLNEEVGELNRAVLQRTYEPDKSTIEDVRTEAIQAAAMAIRFLISLDDYQFEPGEQHQQ